MAKLTRHVCSLVALCLAVGSPAGALPKGAKDRTAPRVTVSLQPPPAGVGGGSALTNGKAFGLEGTVRDADPETGVLVPCGPSPAARICVLQSAEVRQFADPEGGTPSGENIDVTSSVTLDGGGKISGQATVSFEPGTRSARLSVVVADLADNATVSLSSPVDVDTIQPSVQDAWGTVGTLGPDRHVFVRFSEVVCGSTNSLDWTPTPTQVKALGCAVGIELVYTVPLPNEPTETLSYHPSDLSQRFVDRVGLSVANVTVSIR